MAFPLLPVIMGALGATGAGMNLFGKSNPERQIRTDRYTEGQNTGLDQLMNMGLQNMDMKGVEDYAMNKFRSEVVPSLAERFSGMGSGGAQGSSAFGAQLGGAGADLMGQLAAMRPQVGMQQLQMGMQPRFESIFEPKSPGKMQQMGAGLMQAGIGGFMPAMQMGQQQKQFNSQNKISQMMQDPDFQAFLKSRGM